jgi:hypothetical protein
MWKACGLGILAFMKKLGFGVDDVFFLPLLIVEGRAVYDCV